MSDKTILNNGLTEDDFYWNGNLGILLVEDKPREKYQEIKEQILNNQAIVEKLNQYISDLKNVTPNHPTDEIRFGHSWMMISKLSEILKTTYHSEGSH